MAVGSFIRMLLGGMLLGGMDEAQTLLTLCHCDFHYSVCFCGVMGGAVVVESVLVCVEEAAYL